MTQKFRIAGWIVDMTLVIMKTGVRRWLNGNIVTVRATRWDKRRNSCKTGDEDEMLDFEHRVIETSIHRNCNSAPLRNWPERINSPCFEDSGWTVLKKRIPLLTSCAPLPSRHRRRMTMGWHSCYGEYIQQEVECFDICHEKFKKALRDIAGRFWRRNYSGYKVVSESIRLCQLTTQKGNVVSSSTHFRPRSLALTARSFSFKYFRSEEMSADLRTYHSRPFNITSDSCPVR